LGGVFPGERVMHAVMGFLYGAMLANFWPIGLLWWNSPTGFSPLQGIAPLLPRLMTLMAIGVFVSGLRDLSSGLGFTFAAWPWNRIETNSHQPS
jgi:hypothetical protein